MKSLSKENFSRVDFEKQDIKQFDLQEYLIEVKIRIKVLVALVQEFKDFKDLNLLFVMNLGQI